MSQVGAKNAVKSAKNFSFFETLAERSSANLALPLIASFRSKPLSASFSRNLLEVMTVFIFAFLRA